MIAYENCNELCITMPADNDVEAGMLCSMDGRGVVICPGESDQLLGVVKSVKNGLACVMVRGILTVKLSDSIYGWTHLSFDGEGLLAISASDGTPALVLAKNADGTHTIML